MNMSLKVSLQLVGVLIATIAAPGCGGGGDPHAGKSTIKVDCLGPIKYEAVSASQTLESPEKSASCEDFQSIATLEVEVLQPIDYSVFQVKDPLPTFAWPLVGCAHFDHDRQTVHINPYSFQTACSLPNLTVLSPPSPVVTVSVGENAAPNTCGTVDEGQTLTLQCPPGLVMRDVVFADYGLPFGACGSFSFNPFCHDAPLAADILRLVCAGTSTCTINANNGTFSDPCVGIPKHLSAEMTCGQ